MCATTITEFAKPNLNGNIITTTKLSKKVEKYQTVGTLTNME